MAADRILPALGIRSSVGVELWQSNDTHKTYTPNEQFQKDESKFCRAIAYSSDGRYFAWSNGTGVNVANVIDWKIICTLPRPKTLFIKFSPKGTYLATIEHYSAPKDDGEPQPNYCVYEIHTGLLVYSLISKGFSEDWQPDWSLDEGLFALMQGGEALFFEPNGEFGYKNSVHKVGSARGGLVSVAGSGPNPLVALYVPGLKGQPSNCKVFRYPGLEANQIVVSKSFFQADRVDIRWNKRASGLLIMASMDVDASGASYYGKQTLHFMNLKGDSCTVPLSKEGPIHSHEWSPKGNEFCVVYGYMPAKATFFNLKCDPVFEVAEASRNSIYFNPFGNIVLLGGFGNLRGNVEVWDAKDKKLITSFQAPDTTLLQWGADGETILTATTSPRLRIGNGFKVWHYSGALLHETSWPLGQELLEVVWQTFPDDTFKEQPITSVKIEGIKPSQPQSSKAVYVPPNVRNGVPLPTRTTPNKSQPAERAPIPGLPAGYRSSEKLLKKKEARDKKKERKREAKANSSGSSSKESGASGKDPLATFSIPQCEKAKQAEVEKLRKKMKLIGQIKAKRINHEELDRIEVAMLEDEGRVIDELNKLTLDEHLARKARDRELNENREHFIRHPESGVLINAKVFKL